MLKTEEWTHIHKSLSFAFFLPLIPFLYFFVCFDQGSYKLPNDLTSQHSLDCRPEFSHMALVARSVGMILVHLIFKTHTVGTDVFHGDCKMKFRKQEAWAMLEQSVVSGHSVRLTPADNHSCCLGKEVFNTCVQHYGEYQSYQTLKPCSRSARSLCKLAPQHGKH